MDKRGHNYCQAQSVIWFSAAMFSASSVYGDLLLTTAASKVKDECDVKMQGALPLVRIPGTAIERVLLTAAPFVFEWRVSVK